MTERSAAGFVRTALKFERERVSGVLTVRAEDIVTQIHFRAGEACFADGGTVGDSLGRVLVDEGVISDSEYAEAINVMTAELGNDEQMRLGEVLVRRGTLTLAGVHAALDRQVRRKIIRCLQWDSMAMAFSPATGEPPGYHPAAFEPLILEGVRRYFDVNRAQELLKPWLNVFVALKEPAREIVGRYALRGSDAAMVDRIDGSRTIGQLMIALGDEDAPALPILTALFLGDAFEPLRQPRARAAPTAEPARPAPAAPAGPRPRPPAQVTRRATREPLAETRPPPQGRIERPDEVRARYRDDEETIRPQGDDGTQAEMPRRRRNTGRGELPRRQRPSWHGDPTDERFRPDYDSEPEQPRNTRDPLPRRGTHSTGNPVDARRERPTWRSDDLPPRRGAGTNRALQDRPTPHGMDLGEPRYEAPHTTQPPLSSRRARLEAEQAFHRGMRSLHGQRWEDAAGFLLHAADLAPDLLEYQLAAMWGRYRASRDPRELSMLLPELGKLAKRAAIQDRSLPFPPYVLAHLALLEGDEERALRLFKVAAYRDPANTDAERHARMLSKRGR